MKGITILITLICFISLIEFICAETNVNGIATLEELFKPSKAFTVVLMIYMCLIIIGALLVVILIKPKIDN